METWYGISVRVIREVVAENKGATDAQLRKKVSEAYPFGARAYYPYKAWLKAVTDILGPSRRKVDAQRAKRQRNDSVIGQNIMEEIRPSIFSFRI